MADEETEVCFGIIDQWFVDLVYFTPIMLCYLLWKPLAFCIVLWLGLVKAVWLTATSLRYLGLIFCFDDTVFGGFDNNYYGINYAVVVEKPKPKAVLRSIVKLEEIPCGSGPLRGDK